MLPCDEAGQGPAVVLLHAGIADRSMWSAHLRPLADRGYRAIAPDLPGFGEAPLGPGAPWLAVLRTMDALGVGSATLVGNSFGGAVALRVAVVAPERVRALALISAPPPGLEPSAQLAAAWQAEGDAFDRGDIDGAVETVLATWTLPDAPAALRDYVAGAQRRAYEHDAAAGPREEDPDPLDEDPGALARLAMPALVAAGEREMSDFRDGAVALARALPLARHALIAGAGHLAPLETPDAFRSLVLELLAEIEA